MKHLLVLAGPEKVGTKAGGAAEHLLVKNATLHPADEHKVDDGGDVDARGEKIDGDANFGQLLVLVAANEQARFVRLPGYFGDGVLMDASVAIRERLREEIDDHVRVGIVGAEDQRLAGKGGVDVARQLGADRAIERFGNDTAVEPVHVDVDLVGCLSQVDRASCGIEKVECFSGIPVDAFFGEVGDDADRRLVIDQVPVDDSLTIAVGKDRPAEDFTGVKGGRRGEPDTDSVKVLKHATIL